MTTRLPATPEPADHVPVEVRLIGPDPAVRALVAALQRAVSCGSVAYRQARGSDGTRAYLTIVVPPGQATT